MKRTKKILSLILSLCMLFSITAGMDITTYAFTQRTTMPTSSNAYYYANNPFYKSGYGLPNCTCYAFGRAYEVNGTYPNLSTGDASTFYTYNKSHNNYSYGTTPKAGSIVCWSGGSSGKGHVAFVESVNSNGTINISESHWSGRTNSSMAFRYLTYINPNSYSSNLTFQGYIYCCNGVMDSPTTITTPNISFDKSSYTVGDTINITWTRFASPSEFKHYWLVINNVTTNKNYYGTATGLDGDVTKNSYSFKVDEAGTYKVDVYTVRNDGSSGGADSKTVIVSSTVPKAPSYVKTQNNYESFHTSSYIQFDWEKVDGATNYWVYMWKDGVQLYATDMGNSTSFTSAPTSKGNYTFVVKSANATGLSDESAYVNFRVYDIYTVYFNANGGSCSTASKTVYTDAWYGDLPTPTRTNYTFEGWYTSATGGTKITSDMRSDISSNQTLYAHWKQNHTHSYTVSSTTSATCTSNGYITKKCACGDTQTATIKKVSNIKLSATKYTYNGSVKSPTLTVKDSAGKALVKGTDYTVTTPSGRKAVGKYTYKITFKGNYSGTKSLSFTIVPKSTTISSLTAVSKGFTVKWKKQATQTTGYQIQIATDSKFTKGVKNYTVSKNSTVSKKITKLTGKKKYYVRIRTYKTVSGTKYYSSWSGSKSVTTKK